MLWIYSFHCAYKTLGAQVCVPDCKACWDVITGCLLEKTNCSSTWLSARGMIFNKQTSSIKVQPFDRGKRNESVVYLFAVTLYYSGLNHRPSRTFFVCICIYPGVLYCQQHIFHKLVQNMVLSPVFHDLLLLRSLLTNPIFTTVVWTELYWTGRHTVPNRHFVLGAY